MNDSRLRSIVLSGVCSMEEASEMASTLLRAQESKTYSSAAARSTDPETSHEAAEYMRDKTNTMEALVLDALRNLGGKGTAYEVEVWVQIENPAIDSNTITPRFKPLERMGKIERTEDRGPGRGKSTQIVWGIR